MATKSLDFYFDYLSPYAWFAWRQITGLCAQHQLTLRPHPVVFGKLLDHWGQLGPAEIPPKREWLTRYCLRYASVNGFNYDPPKFHPFNPLPALRLSLKEVAGDQQMKVIQTLFEAGWTQGEDLGDPENLIRLLLRAGINADQWLEKIADPAVKQLLVQETSDAIGRGVFGVPIMIVKDQLFWGNDQFEHMQLLLLAKDPWDPEKQKKIGARPRGIDRKGVKQKLSAS